MLRIDDIPQQVADDMHAFGVIGALAPNINRNSTRIFLIPLHRKNLYAKLKPKAVGM